jgi:hypothetical protein
MDDPYINIIIKSEPVEIQKLCSTNKHYNALCKHYSEYISKKVLERKNVNYKDSSIDMYTWNGARYNPRRSYHEMFKLYLKTQITVDKPGSKLFKQALIKNNKCEQMDHIINAYFGLPDKIPPNKELISNIVYMDGDLRDYDVGCMTNLLYSLIQSKNIGKISDTKYYEIDDSDDSDSD